MSWSAAEITALASKAARGAGAPAAQADRFGSVAALHLMAGRNVMELAAALDALPAGPLLDFPVAIDRALSDAGQGLPAYLCGVAQCPLLASYVAALPFQASLVEEGDALRLKVDLTTPSARAQTQRIVDCDRFIAQMAALATLTFVPESDASREAGAGAGLTDND